MGPARLSCPFHCVFAQRGTAGPRCRCFARGLSHHIRRIMLDLHSYGASRRAIDAQRWHALHDDLLRQSDGREELQYYGRCQSRVGKRRSLPRRRAWTEGDSRARDFSGSAGNARSLRHTGIRCLAEQSQGQSSSKKLGQH
jgi:hypothetical protein